MYRHCRDSCCTHLLGDLASGDIENVLNVSIQSTSTQCHHAKAVSLSRYLITRFLCLDITYAEIELLSLQVLNQKLL